MTSASVAPDIAAMATNATTFLTTNDARLLGAAASVIDRNYVLGTELNNYGRCPELDAGAAARGHVGRAQAVVDVHHALDARGDLGAGEALRGVIDDTLERDAAVERSYLDVAVRCRRVGAQRRAHVMHDRHVAQLAARFLG